MQRSENAMNSGPVPSTEPLPSDDPRDERGVRISLMLLLPRDTSSVPLARHLCTQAIHEVGGSPDDAEDIGLALTEACANAILHCTVAAPYRVEVVIDPPHCFIEITNQGVDEAVSFDPSADRTADPFAERGRGLVLMRTLVDDLDVCVTPSTTAVRMSRELKIS
jgi:anti-sigma regulatory factor (Ser/Thr protein kinase)